MSFSYSKIPSSIPHYVYSCLLKLLLATHFLRLPLSLMTLAVLRSTGQVFCRISSSCDLCHGFHMIRFVLYVLGRKTIELKCHFHYIPSYYQYNLSLLVLTLITWLRKYLSGFSTVNFLNSSPFPYCLLQKKVTMHSPYLRSGELRITSLMAEYLHKLL